MSGSTGRSPCTVSPLPAPGHDTYHLIREAAVECTVLTGTTIAESTPSPPTPFEGPLPHNPPSHQHGCRCWDCPTTEEVCKLVSNVNRGPWSP